MADFLALAYGFILRRGSGRADSEYVPTCILHTSPDAHEQLGQPIVSNGLPLTKIYHAAFDAHLIGIDPDFRIHVSDRLLEIHDGPFLEIGLKGIAGKLIDRPRRHEDLPDRDRLAIRFEQFNKAA